MRARVIGSMEARVKEDERERKEEVPWEARIEVGVYGTSFRVLDVVGAGGR